jgi:hypothetical protein
MFEIEKKGVWITLFKTGYSIRIRWILIEAATAVVAWWFATLVVANHIFSTTSGMAPGEVSYAANAAATLLVATAWGEWRIRKVPLPFPKGWFLRVARWALAATLSGLGRVTLALAKATTPP